MHYSGEHIAIGFAGQLLVFASFISLVAALVCYIFSCREKLLNFRSWRFYGRHFFRLHFFIVIAVMSLLWIMLINHHNEYKFVWEHTSSDLPLGYLIASLWSGQEGSFLLWLFCQGLMGVLVMRRSGDFERPVMIVFAAAQFFLNAALLGIHIGSLKIGSDPFILLRNSPENILNPFFNNPDYLSVMKPGAGLNPLLKNFWMKAHPPMLFLGFASMLVPFAYAFAALWKEKFSGWLRPVIPWTSFAILAMGAGILMGGAWAYQDLTFGGFWAWDPVENSSLVCWLLLVISLHLLMISIVNKQTLFPAILLTFFSYIMALYSTFLTRSGVLATTSAHSFNKTGSYIILAAFMVIFFLGPLILLFIKKKKFPKSENEKFLSREFWMFTGCIILVLAAFQIIFSTSSPLINKIFGSHIGVPDDTVEYYNSWQLPFAIIILLGIGFTQYLTYGKNYTAVFIKKILPPLITAFVFSVLLYFFSGIRNISVIVLAFSALFVIFSSFDILLRHFRYSRNFPSLLGHAGLGIFIFGILLAFAQSRTLTDDSSKVSLGEHKNAREDILLVKDSLIASDQYYLRYSENKRKSDEQSYSVKFYNVKDTAQPALFTLRPSVITSAMGNVYKPDIKHYLTRDIFMYILYAQEGGPKDMIVARTIVFPYIKIVWAGGIIMLLGTLLSVLKRRKYRVPSEGVKE